MRVGLHAPHLVLEMAGATQGQETTRGPQMSALRCSARPDPTDVRTTQG